MDSINKKIQNYKDNDIFIIFYSDWCPFCKNTFQLLDKHKKSCKGYNIDKLEGKEVLIEKLKLEKDLTGYDINHKTIPIIFYKGKFIGGLSELKLFFKKGINK